MKVRTALSVILTVLAGAASADPIADAATAIQEKLKAGDATGALSVAADLYGQIWDQNPAIGFTQGLLEAESATGFGIYNPRPNNVFKKGEPILIYAEPYGFDYGTPGQGLYSVNLVVDLQVLDASGNQLANVPQATEYDITSRHKNREVQVNITYTLDGIQPGHYTLVTTLRDKNSQKAGSFQTAIEIAK